MAVVEKTPEEEKLKTVSGELFENLRSSTIVQSKNGGSKRGKKVVNDEGDFKKSKKQKSKSKMKKAIHNLQDRVAGDEGDRKGFEGLVDHTLESEEVDNAKTEDVNTGSHRDRTISHSTTTRSARPLRAWITDKRTDDERILVAKWPQYKECIKENRLFNLKEEYRLVDYVVGSKKDFQDP
ncbi:Ulp1-like peptidase [Cucumis melo var. makuwa]|uniref:Ulp1-like peptidase n=1 Tax=Cucumis melo var. makuwa TaxID=1194695 RepID=A0A5A7U1U4_CUCMM|nr:Ulp1-like peptidase [Cucumis melo var. makuwa]